MVIWCLKVYLKCRYLHWIIRKQVKQPGYRCSFLFLYTKDIKLFFPIELWYNPWHQSWKMFMWICPVCKLKGLKNAWKKWSDLKKAPNFNTSLCTLMARNPENTHRMKIQSFIKCIKVILLWIKITWWCFFPQICIFYVEWPSCCAKYAFCS